MYIKLMHCRLILVVMLIGLIPIFAVQAKRPSGSKTIRAVLLPVQADGFSEQVKRQLRAVAVGELRDIGIFNQVSTWRMLKKLQRLEKRRIYGKKCMYNPVCVRTLGGVLGARVIFLLKTNQVGQEVSLSMQSFDTKSGKVIRQEEEEAEQETTELERAVRWLTRKVSSPLITTLAKGKGRFKVDCKEKDAVLVVNGKSFGKQIGKSFKVSSGVFDISVTKKGFGSFRDVVVIKPGQAQTIVAALEPELDQLPPVSAVPPQEKEKPAWLSAETTPSKPAATDIQPMTKTEEAEKAEAMNGPRRTPVAEKEKPPPWMVADSQKKPFLPAKEKQPEPVPTRRKEKSKFYQSWWFWTIVGVVAAGGGGLTYYLVSQGDDPSEGSAIVTWP